MVKVVVIYAALMVVFVQLVWCGTGTEDVTYERQLLLGKKLEAVFYGSGTKVICNSDEGEDQLDAETGNPQGNLNKKRQPISKSNDDDMDIDMEHPKIKQLLSDFEDWQRSIQGHPQISNSNDMDISHYEIGAVETSDEHQNNDDVKPSTKRHYISNDDGVGEDIDRQKRYKISSDESQNINEVNPSTKRPYISNDDVVDEDTDRQLRYKIEKSDNDGN